MKRLNEEDEKKMRVTKDVKRKKREKTEHCEQEVMDRTWTEEKGHFLTFPQPFQ